MSLLRRLTSIRWVPRLRQSKIQSTSANTTATYRIVLQIELAGSEGKMLSRGGWLGIIRSRRGLPVFHTGRIRNQSQSAPSISGRVSSERVARRWLHSA